jgi:hypothetical protein
MCAAYRFVLPALLLLGCSFAGPTFALQAAEPSPAAPQPTPPHPAEPKKPAPEKAPQFHPGEWEIDSTITVFGGRAITSTTRLCATKQMDFWKVAQHGLSCKEPKTSPDGDGTRVRIHCVYQGEKLHSDIEWDAIETFANDGNSFTLTGTSKTNTVYEGVQPTQTTAQLQANAHRIGECR